MRLFVYFSLVFGSGAQASTSSVTHLAEGTPGCWALIHSGSVSEEDGRHLSKNCRNFRNDYFASVDWVKKNPAQYEKKIVQTLDQAKSAKAPYEAIFFATLIHSKKLTEALTRRAAVEKKLKVPFAYAAVALRHLKGKPCSPVPQYSHVYYRELCEAQDSILPTFFKFSGLAAGSAGRAAERAGKE